MTAFQICAIEIRLSYPLRHFVTPPLTIRGGMRGGATPPYHKIRGGMVGQKRKPDKVLRSRYAFRLNKTEKGYVKTRRRVADSRRIRKFRRRECTQKYMTETNTGEAGRCALIPRLALSSETVTVKTRRYKQSAKGADLPP